MKKTKQFWEKGLHPITGFEQGENWNYNDELKKQNERQKQKRKAMRKQVELSTGIKTRQNKKQSGVIEILVQNNDYDTMYDQVCLDTDLREETVNLMYNIFKPL